MVTAEAALATLSLTALAVLLSCAVGVLAAQLRVNDAARVAARAAALGLEAPAAPGIDVSWSRTGSTVLASAVTVVSFPVPGLAPRAVRAEAAVIDETADLLGSAGG